MFRKSKLTHVFLMCQDIHRLANYYKDILINKEMNDKQIEEFLEHARINSLIDVTYNYQMPFSKDRFVKGKITLLSQERMYVKPVDKLTFIQRFFTSGGAYDIAYFSVIRARLENCLIDN